MLYADYQHFIVRRVENRKIFFADYVGNRKIFFPVFVGNRIMFIFLYKTKNLRAKKITISGSEGFNYELCIMNYALK